MEEEEKYLKKQRIYKGIMLVILTAFITFILTTAYILNKYDIGDVNQSLSSLFNNSTSDDGTSINYIKKILKKLGIKIKNKKYTEYELECLTMDLLAYYDDTEMDLSEEEKQFPKSLEDTKVSREEYNILLDKVQSINEGL